MTKNGNAGKSLANPLLLDPLDKDNKNLIRVVVETPKGSRNKYAFDPKLQVFELKKVLPAGMAFPYDLDRGRRRRSGRCPGADGRARLHRLRIAMPHHWGD